MLSEERGARRWKFCRWINTNNPADLDHMNKKLIELHQLFPETASLCAEFLIAVISSFATSSDSQIKDSSEESDNDERLEQLQNMAPSHFNPLESQASSMHRFSSVDMSQGSFNSSSSSPGPLINVNQAPALLHVPSIGTWGITVLRDTLSTTALRFAFLHMQSISIRGESRSHTTARRSSPPALLASPLRTRCSPPLPHGARRRSMGGW
jgi:hypothetical protein